MGPAPSTAAPLRPSSTGTRRRRRRRKASERCVAVGNAPKSEVAAARWGAAGGCNRAAESQELQQQEVEQQQGRIKLIVWLTDA